MLAKGRGGWAVSQKRYYDPKEQGMWRDTLYMFTNDLVCRRIPSGASQPIGIFHTLRKGVKTILMGLLDKRSLFPCVCVCLPRTTCFFLAPLCLSPCYAGYSMLVTNLLINFVSCLTEETTYPRRLKLSLLASSPFMWNAKRGLGERVSKRWSTCISLCDVCDSPPKK